MYPVSENTKAYCTIPHIVIFLRQNCSAESVTHKEGAFSKPLDGDRYSLHVAWLLQGDHLSPDIWFLL